ncbi:diaminopropionate ammonia-lyase [Spirosoma validum]|uniref:Diaminopropionate ammonia-lyase n=1 Tax=Spirosoma validum TaxID=2771355 RepID=A0A927B430_9BACT|nr:diaminopropionate ammonia-lyase [Spirosoma validum]MBD2755255.1 diaminopropionate ammonia-lyase [Spirosoma validum]
MIHFNESTTFNQPLTEVDSQLLGELSAQASQRFWQSQPAYRPTPLQALSALASSLSIGELYVKDEAHRLGLQSFKALGGAYAVVTLAQEEVAKRLGQQVSWETLRQPIHQEVIQRLTFACATDGNHGRSVAFGAQLVGAKAVIFVHPGVSQRRRQRMAELGAQIVEVPGSYDDAVREASRVSDRNGWLLTSDTSWPGYEHVPGLVMQGYLTLWQESISQLPRLPSHIFIQAGVGGLAAALAGHLASCWGADRPKIIIVEPQRAACLFESAKADQRVSLPPGESTVMAMLECYEPSAIAWRILLRTTDAFLTIRDEMAIDSMIRLARPLDDDPAIISGESGGAGLAGLLQVCQHQDWREALGITSHSCVMVINTEGATDPDRYEALVGIPLLPGSNESVN